MVVNTDGMSMIYKADCLAMGIDKKSFWTSS